MAALLGTKQANWSTILGFGLNESAIVPFETVMKDGYMLVGCVQDKMRTTADKHGDGKWEYKNHAGVSVIFYDRIITDPEEKKPMTPEVCYNFCRTIPDAGFFGLVAGRQCYCEPYFEMEASDSSECDAVCEGEPTSFCGGMTKQSIYSMHLCADTGKDMNMGSAAGMAAQTLCTKVHREVKDEIGNLTALGNAIKARAGSNGDPTTASFGQLALEYVGMLNDGLAAAEAMKTDLEGLTSQYAGFQGADFTDADTITEAEELNAKTKALADKATEICSPYKYFLEPLANGTDSVKAYYPITYWTEPSENRAAAANMTLAPLSACEGVPAGGPRIVSSMDECANICDSMVTPGKDKCIAFQYASSAEGAMCSPLNKIEGITYYDAPSSCTGLLQKQSKTQCYEVPGFSCSNQASSRTWPNVCMEQECDGCAECSAGGGGEGGAEGGGGGSNSTTQAFPARCLAKFSLMKGFDLRVNSKDASVDHVETKVLKRCA